MANTDTPVAAWLMLRLLSVTLGGYLGGLLARVLGADSGSSPLDPASPVTWVSFGVAGVVSLAFIRGWVVAGSTAAKCEARAEAAEIALRDLLPALTKSNDAIAATNATTDKMLDYLDRSRGGK